MIPTKEELALAIDETEWSWLRPHLERGGIILVDGSIELAEAALKVAADDAASIQEWISRGLIGKPSDVQIKEWDGSGKKFAMLIVSPYILIQEQVPATC